MFTKAAKLQGSAGDFSNHQRQHYSPILLGEEINEKGEMKLERRFGPCLLVTDLESEVEV